MLPIIHMTVTLIDKKNQELKSFICHAAHYSYDHDNYWQKIQVLKSFICHAAHNSYDRDNYWQKKSGIKSIYLSRCPLLKSQIGGFWL
jgi:hypothetical protein